jgi:hypothetical protein
MADREQDALVCATRRREREARPVDLERYACRCDHDHPPEVSWCDLCENPVFHGPDPAYRHGGPDAGWYLRTMGGWRRISDTEAANERYEGMRHFMHDPREQDVTTIWGEHGAEISVEQTQDHVGHPVLRLAIANRFENGPTWWISVELTPDTAEELAANITGWLCSPKQVEPTREAPRP